MEFRGIFLIYKTMNISILHFGTALVFTELNIN